MRGNLLGNWLFPVRKRFIRDIDAVEAAAAVAILPLDVPISDKTKGKGEST